MENYSGFIQWLTLLKSSLLFHMQVRYNYIILGNILDPKTRLLDRKTYKVGYKESSIPFSTDYKIIVKDIKNDLQSVCKEFIDESWYLSIDTIEVFDIQVFNRTWTPITEFLSDISVVYPASIPVEPNPDPTPSLNKWGAWKDPEDEEIVEESWEAADSLEDSY